MATSAALRPSALSSDTRPAKTPALLPDDDAAETGDPFAQTYQEWQEEIRRELQAYDPGSRHMLPEDRLQERYRIEVSRPLPELDSQMAKAYQASDERDPELQLYALVLQPGLPYRLNTLKAWTGFRHPSLCACHAYGECRISSLGEQRMVIVMERPRGKRLSELLAAGKRFDERRIAAQVIRPLTEIVAQFEAHGVNHGRINPDNIYFENGNIQLGEALSEPSGYSQHFLYEPSERLFAQPMGKGSGDVGADCYALGVLALHLAIGRLPLPDIQPQQYAHRVTQSGAYHTLIGSFQLTEFLDDLLRGTLQDLREDRWRSEHIFNWLSGKRYNLNPPTLPRESVRSYDYKGQTCFNRKSLAYCLSANWTMSRQSLKDPKLIRWVETGLHKAELADGLRRALAIGAPGTERAQDEMVARAVQLLDPTGPIRLNTVSFNIDGLGGALADAMRQNDDERKRGILQILSGDMLSLAFEQQQHLQNSFATATIARMQLLRPILRKKELGFGIERVLYELNPTMSCQGELVEDHHVMTAEQLLIVLNAIAPKFERSYPPLDRHTAAFLAKHLGLKNELYVNEVSRIPQMASHSAMVTLKLLATAQRKLNTGPLPGLALWCASQLGPVMGFIHRRSVRESLQGHVLKAARDGNIEHMARYMFNTSLIYADQEEFQKAVKAYGKNGVKIREYTNPEVLSLRAHHLGRNISVSIAYLTALVTVYLVVQPYVF